MANNGQRIATIMVAATVMGASGNTAANESPKTIVLTVENRCGMATAILEGAQRTVEAVYAAIGVRVAWTVPMPGSSVPTPGTTRLRVVLVSEGSEESVLAALPVPKEIHPLVIGAAPTTTRTAFIFCSRVARRAAKSKMNWLDIALGRAIAHEVGHLVLPGQGHSESGIMRPSLDLHSEKTHGFTADQGESIRALLMAGN